jgi:hypothetical protein
MQRQKRRIIRSDAATAAAKGRKRRSERTTTSWAARKVCAQLIIISLALNLLYLGSGHSSPQPITPPEIPITNIDLPVTGPFPLAGDQIARQKFPIADLPSSSAPFPPICADVRTTHIVGCDDSFHGKLRHRNYGGRGPG